MKSEVDIQQLCNLKENSILNLKAWWRIGNSSWSTSLSKSSSRSFSKFSTTFCTSCVMNLWPTPPVSISLLNWLCKVMVMAECTYSLTTCNEVFTTSTITHDLPLGTPNWGHEFVHCCINNWLMFGLLRYLETT